MAERSKFWSRASLKVDRENCSEVILSTRINIVPAVRLLGSLTADQLTAIYQMLDERKPDTLKELHLIRIDHSNVSSEVLASSIARMEKVTLFGNVFSGLSSEQVTAIYQRISSSTSLKELRVFATNHLAVPADLLASALTRMQKVE